jgi:hypothetical protein
MTTNQAFADSGVRTSVLEQIKAVAKKDPNITQQDMNNFQTIIAS